MHWTAKGQFIIHERPDHMDLIWTSDSSGDAELVNLVIRGRCEKLLCIATDSPTDNWDVVILNDHGGDVLGGLGVDAGPNAGSRVTYLVGPDSVTSVPGVVFSGEPHVVSISGAGMAKSGVVQLWYSQPA